MEPARILVYRFLSLPHVTRLDIARMLELYPDDAQGLDDGEVINRILKRASDESKLAAFWDEIERKHADGKYESNPFEQKAS